MSGPKTPASPSPKKSTPSKQMKVFDIRRPGKAIASPTSRPVIMPPKVKDSVLVAKPQAPKHTRITDDPDEKHGLMDSTKKVTVQPSNLMTSSNIPESTDAKPADGDAPTPAPQQTPPPPANANVASTVEETLQDAGMQQLPPSIAVEPTAPIPQPSVRQLARPEPVPTPPSEPHDAEEVFASTAPPEVDMSHAVISTHVTPRRHLWREVLVFVGLLLFIAAAFDTLLDAGLLHLHGVPHTSLFTSGN